MLDYLQHIYNIIPDFNIFKITKCAEQILFFMQETVETLYDKEFFVRHQKDRKW